MSTRPFNPLPACPHPIQWDVSGRITELQTMIDDPTTSEPQKKNLQTAINLYRENELPGHFKWIQEGKVVPHKNIDFKRPYWVEIFARVRPVPGLLSPAISIDVTLLNDTGSNTLTVFDTDITALGIPPTYMGYGADVLITTAGGTLRRRQISVEIQLLDSQGNAVSDWILEAGIVTPATAGATRLSGDGIRQSLYFATAPGNQHLYVAEKKNGIITQLPVI
ncbi:hypothetical protein TESG_05111 [Trichophyton tonsurans CBS 112818]|uniref:Uncharacterized protein n=1 Tax=Trichophyton tonsurans (strain CBS 112818) TaxID=647933 RepID=F2S2B1_TRIT1|nr:hypothetical protein TESG_05111 [Trichophyton tonsurans CBS 112818]